MARREAQDLLVEQGDGLDGGDATGDNAMAMALAMEYSRCVNIVPWLEAYMESQPSAVL